ncbi:hypothetical protein M9Y10_009458 [Tritrichomonas musculus]|uniref:Protein kinase domain-containing protein n=1 Tax=Tritrichomonas musculus TaxID=1915356 RepID=A0ABR2INL3_9EUKA
MKKKKAIQPKPPMSLVLHPKKAPRPSNAKILPSLVNIQEPPSSARPKTNNKRSPRNIRKKPVTKPGNRISENDQYKSLPNAPLLPSTVLKDHGPLLTERERFEIERYHDIYYIRKEPPAPQSQMLYDPDFFPFIKDDHIKYQYQQLDELGRGAFGCVIKCYDHKHKRTVAVKLVRDKPKLHQQVQLEKEVLEAFMAKSDLSCQNHIIKIYEIFIYRSFVVFVFEVLSSNLYEALKADKFKGLDMTKVRIVTGQIASSIKFLHSLGFIHCDIKPENMLWTNPRHLAIKLIDFGCCCHANHTLFTYIQSRFYRAPEVILGLEYGLPIDIWSIGCVIYELITGRPLFGGENENEQMSLYISVLGPPPDSLLKKATRKEHFFEPNNKPINKPNSKGRIHLPSSRPLKALLKTNDELLINFLEGCLRWIPEERYTAELLTQHPWLKKAPRK